MQIGDGFQRIIDFMGDAGGQPAHGGEFFRVTQGVFRTLALGYVNAEHNDAGNSCHPASRMA